MPKYVEASDADPNLKKSNPDPDFKIMPTIVRILRRPTTLQKN